MCWMMWQKGHRGGLRDAHGIALVVISSICIAFVPSAAKISMNEGASLVALLISRCLIGAVMLLPVIVVQRRVADSSSTLGQDDHCRPFQCCDDRLPLQRGSARRCRPCDFDSLHVPNRDRHLVTCQRQTKGKCCAVGRSGWAVGGAVATAARHIAVRQSERASFVFWFNGLRNVIHHDVERPCGQPRIGAGQSAKQYLELWILSLVLFLPLGQEIALPETTMGRIAILSNGIFYLLGYWLCFEGCRLIGVTRASILTLVDPLFAAVVAILFLDQHLSSFEWTGFVIILSALLVFEIRKSGKTAGL